MRDTPTIRAIVTVCILMALGACSMAQPSGPGTSVSQDQAAIYRAVLKSWFGSERHKQLVDQRLEPAPSASDPEFADCVKGLSFTQGATSNETALSRTFGGGDIELVDGEKWKPTDPEDAIGRGRSVRSAVRNAFAGSLISFSQVAFSDDHKDAVFKFSMACGRLCGSGSMLRMHKDGGRWRIAGHCSESIS